MIPFFKYILNLTSVPFPDCESSARNVHVNRVMISVFNLKYWVQILLDNQ